MRPVNLLVLFLLIFAPACAPNPPATPTATLLPPTATPPPRTISFSTPDGADIEGTVYGSGKTAVIFSVMGNCKRGWDDTADLVSQHGVVALTYQWRGCRDTGYSVDSELRKFVDDLRGAIQYMRGQGAEKLILAGASLGGVASAKLAAETSPDGLVIVASPRTIEGWGFEIESGDVHIDVPKLFITAENDSVVPASRSQQLFDLLAQPKEWQTYPGTAHGTDIFQTESGEAMQKRILDFILAIASKP